MKKINEKQVKRFIKTHKQVIKWISMALVILVVVIFVAIITNNDDPEPLPVVQELIIPTPRPAPTATPEPTPEPEPIPIEFIVLPEGDAELDGHALRIETTGGNQWDGVQISTEALSMELGNIYHFSVDVFSPITANHVAVGLMMQTNAPLWMHIINTPSFLPDNPPVWHRFEGALDLRAIATMPTHLQIVKNNLGPNPSADLAFFIDNFEVRRGDEVVAFFDFEDYVQPFAMSGSSSFRIAVAPSMDIHRVNFDEDWEFYSDYIVAGGHVEVQQAQGAGVGDEYSLRVTNTTGNFASGAGNYIRFNFPNRLEVGGTYELTWWTFIPSEENPGRANIPGASIVLNGNFGSAPHQPMNYFDLDTTTPMDRWEESRTVFIIDHVVGNIDHMMIRFRINDEDRVPRIWYVDNIRLTPLGREDAGGGWDISVPSLHQRFGNYFAVGNILEPEQVRANPFSVLAMYNRHFNAVTAEYVMTPSLVAGGYTMAHRPNNLSLINPEAMVEFAERQNHTMIGNALVWHEHTAPWMNLNPNGGYVTRSQAMENLRWFIQNYAGHFEGRVDYWDVVKNAFTDQGQASSVHLRPIGSPIYDVGTWQRALRNDVAWYHAFGNGADFAEGERAHDYIYYAFVFARRYAPSARLIYSDFNEEAANKRDAIVNMVNYMNNRWANDSVNNPAYDNPNHPQYGRLLVEVIGMQSRFDQTTNLENVRSAIERFITTGAQIHVTELSIAFPNITGVPYSMTAYQQQQQANMFAELFSMYMEFSDYIDRVTIWGRDDGSSPRGHLTPVAFDNFFRPKPAFWAITEPVNWIELRTSGQ